MFGVFVNAVAIAVGSIIGVFVKNQISERITNAVMSSLGLFTLFVGIQGTLKSEKSIIVLLSIAIGTFIGALIDLNKYFEMFGEFLKKKVVRDKNSESAKFVDAFVTASALMGIGAMALLGSIEAGLEHNYTIFFLKSLMDFIAAIVFSTTMGIGVAFASITIIVFQGSMTLAASLLKPLAENTLLMNELICCGNLMIMATGFNIIGLTKIKVANMLPALIFLPIIYYIAIMINI